MGLKLRGQVGMCRRDPGWGAGGWSKAKPQKSHAELFV